MTLCKFKGAEVFELTTSFRIKKFGLVGYLVDIVMINIKTTAVHYLGHIDRLYTSRVDKCDLNYIQNK